MESEAKYVIVGAAMIVLTVLALLAGLWVSETGVSRNAKYYTIYFQNHTLNGLQVDSHVTMRGVKIGSVRDFEISPKNIELVKVSVAVQETTPVKNDTKAIIRRNLLTGLATVDLVKSSQAAKMLAQVKNGEKYPVIPEGRSELDQVADSLPRLVERMGEMVGRFSAFFSDENRNSFALALKNTSAFTKTLDDNRDDVAGLIANFNQLGAELTKLSQELTSVAEKVDNNVDGVSTELRVALEQMNETTATIDKVVREMSDSVSAAAEVVSVQAGSVAQDLSVVAQSVGPAAERFENPRAILVGPAEQGLGPGESLPR